MNLSFIDKILREETQSIENIYQQQEQQKRCDVLRRLSFYDENGTLHILINNDDFNTNDMSISMLRSEIDSCNNNNDDDDVPSDKKWLYDTIHSVGIRDKLDDWLQNKDIHNNHVTVGYSEYKHLDLTKVNFNEIEFTNKFQKTIATSSSHYVHQQIFLKTYIHSHTTCEYGLITIYARHTLLNMLKVWYDNDHSNLFPFSKLGDEKLIVKLIRFMHHHHYHTYAHMSIDKSSNILSIIQKQIVEESIHFLTNPSLIDINNNNNVSIDEQIFIKQSNLDFILKVFQLFLEVLKDFERKNDDIDLVIRLLFPGIIIKILFDLFLIVPSHHLKQFIHDLFTKLIQTSENFKLHNDIHNFLRYLFLETTVNEMYADSIALKFFRRFLIQLQLVLIERENQLVSSVNEWSSFMKDLAIVFGLIIILTNKKKPYQWSELLFTAWKEALGEKATLTKEMIETADTYFDRNADEQLIKLVNQNIKFDEKSLSFESIMNFIDTLAVESISDSTNITSGISFIVDRIRLVRHCILFTAKLEMLSAALAKTAINLESSEVDIKFDTIKASTAEHPEDTIFYQAYKQLKSEASKIFRQKEDERVWNATYVGMFSNDQGGPYRDSITRICADLCSTRLLLFILCPNGRINNGLNRDRWIPNILSPNRPISFDIKNQYHFVGQLMGMAIRKKQYLDVRFPILLWKQLLYEEVTIEDIEAIDISSFAVMNKVEEDIRKVRSLNECDYLFSGIMTELTFDVVSSVGQTYELIPDGFHIRILTPQIYL